MRLLFFFFVSLMSAVLPAQNGTAVTPMPTFFNPLTLRNKNCIATTAGGDVWIGLRDNGIIYWNGSAWNYFDTNSGLSDYNVHCLDFDPNGDAWAGTDTGGVCRYDGMNWTVYATWNSPLPSKKVLCTVRQGPLRWFGTTRGLVSFDGTNWTIYNTQNSGICSDTINDIDFSVSGEVLVGTSRGFIRFNGSSWYGGWPVNSAPVENVYVHTDGSEWITVMGVLQEKTGNVFGPSDWFFDIPWSNFGAGVKLVAKGPNGGVGFGSTRGTLNEIINDRVFTYYPTGLLVNNNSSYALWSIGPSGECWFVNSTTITSTSPGIHLFRFDPQQYNGLGLGMTPANNRNLDINQVSARLLNRGDMHWDMTSARYNVPKSGSACTIFCSALWIGGLDSGGALHQAAMTYRQRGMDYIPGPIDPLTGSCDSATAWKFDRIWKISAYQVSEFQWQFANGNVQNGTYLPPADLIDWPALGNYGVTQPLAHFADVNGNGIYDPLTGGDYPLIHGDEELFFVFNDAVPHTETNGLPLGVEIQAHAYAYACSSAPDSLRAINYTTFYSYDIINRSQQVYSNAAITFMNETDLGNWQDDLVGCQPSLNASFAYNGDPVDEFNSAGSYNNYPPMQSAVVLEGPVAPPNDSIDNDNDGVTDEAGEQELLTSFMHWMYNVPLTAYNFVPQAAWDYYHYSTARWRDSTHLTFGGNGHGGNTAANFLYPSLPDDTLGWNEFTAGNLPNDRSMLLGTGVFGFLPGDTVHYTIALITTFDSANAWNSHAYYQRMVSDIQHVQQWYAADSFPSCQPLFDLVPENSSVQPALRLYPNPATERVSIVYSATTKAAVIEIYDANGKRIFAGNWGDRTSLSLPVEAWQSGLYFVRIIDGPVTAIATFVKQ